ncbi:NFACT RNA binding domain-containing protein [Desulfovibrio sp. OttesenSCG-928-A18]|nr:NFACT RNA binding domain-containing protein [Desulfovibrio sp. OttesenSCG-928-A18]
MRLRKYCSGRRLGRAHTDFVARSLAFVLSGGPEQDESVAGGSCLLLDLVAGPQLLHALPEGYGASPVWPDAATVDALCAAGRKKAPPGECADELKPWLAFGVLTPLLRETLAELDPMEGRALMVDLECGGGDLFLYAASSGKAVLYSAWPLPEALLERKGLRLMQDPFEGADADPQCLVLLPGALADAREKRSLFPLWPEYPNLARAGLVDERAFVDGLAARRGKAEEKPLRREQKRLARLRAKLDQEEERLRSLLALREDGKALQAVLWQYKAGERRASVTLHAGTAGERVLILDPLCSITENMERMFRQSARGERGLAFLRERRRQLFPEAFCPAQAGKREHGAAGPGPDSGHEAVKGEREPLRADGALREKTKAQQGDPQAFGPHGSGGQASGPRPLPDLPEHGGQGGKEGSDYRQYRGVARFLSSDGFLILRGKNAKGNQRLLKIGSAHDLWLHAEGGPSAHVLVRRSHAAEEIPERTLQEAALLVLEKSWMRDSGKGHVMVALLRHVHAVKGAAPGSVRVDEQLSGLTVRREEGGGP